MKARKLVAYLLAVDRRQRDFEALPSAALGKENFHLRTHHRERQHAGPCPGKKKKTFC